MPNSLQSSAIASPASRRATNCSLSSITEHSFQGITTSPSTGRKCHLCVRYNVLPMSQVAHPSRFNNLRCVFNFRFCFVFTDNTDNIGDLGRKYETQAHRFCLFQTECNIFFHLAIAVSHGLIFMSHPKSFQVSMDAILSEPCKPVSAESMKACFGLLQFPQSGM